MIKRAPSFHTRLFQTTKTLALIGLSLVLSAALFQFLVIKQERLLQRYFVEMPRERLDLTRASLSESLSRSFTREHRYSSLEGLVAYIRKEGSTPLYDLRFVFKDDGGVLKEIGERGIAPVDASILRGEYVYTAVYDNGNAEGYLIINMKESGAGELKEGLYKYRLITYSLRGVFFLLVLTILAVIFYYDYSAKMRLARDLAEIRASNDGLTGLHTHEYFLKMMHVEVEKVRIYDTPLALLMLDIDHFKKFNDTYGHQAGDKVLEEVSKIVKISTRSSDILSRYGGEEFAVIVPYVTKHPLLSDERGIRQFGEEIKNVADRIRVNIEDAEIAYGGKKLKVTASIGVAFYYRKSYALSAESLIKKADGALYEAKHSGRNRIFIDYSRGVPAKKR